MDIYMGNVVARSNNLYMKFVVDDLDVAEIKECLFDFYYSGFNIDSDFEEQALFHDITFPGWIESNLIMVDQVKALAQGVSTTHETGEAIISVHLHDGTCVGVTISEMQDNNSYHRYAAIHPDHRGQNLIEELRWLALAFGFDYAKFQSTHINRPATNSRDWSGRSTVLGEHVSSARGSQDTYIERVITAEDWLAIKADPNSPAQNYTFTFEEI